MIKTTDALKNLGKKCNTEGEEPNGKTTAEIIESIAENFNINGKPGADGKDGKDGKDGTDGTDGADGASVTAITLYTSEGTITGGVATLSDTTEIEITVTEQPAE